MSATGNISADALLENKKIGKDSKPYKSFLESLIKCALENQMKLEALKIETHKENNNELE